MYTFLKADTNKPLCNFTILHLNTKRAQAYGKGRKIFDKNKNINNYLYNIVQYIITFSGNEHDYILNSRHIPKSHKLTGYQK